jgi:hypothetical protein
MESRSYHLKDTLSDKHTVHFLTLSHEKSKVDILFSPLGEGQMLKHLIKLTLDCASGERAKRKKKLEVIDEDV